MVVAHLAGREYALVELTSYVEDSFAVGLEAASAAAVHVSSPWGDAAWA